MKTFLLMSLALFLLSAHAEERTIRCSNSNASVIWDTNPNIQKIDLKYSNFVEGTLTLDLSQVKITFDKEVSLREKSAQDCSYRAYMRVFAAGITIVASDEYPDVLRSQFPDNKIETDVICTEYVKLPRPCPR